MITNNWIFPFQFFTPILQKPPHLTSSEGVAFVYVKKYEQYKSIDGISILLNKRLFNQPTFHKTLDDLSVVTQVDDLF